jgi:uncharacterized membrane protein YkoI
MAPRLKIALVVLLALLVCVAVVAASYDGKQEQEQQVTLEQLPAAVKATLTSEAGSGTIDEIVKVTEGDKVIYEADVLKDGKKYEVQIAEDGTLIKSAVDDEEEADKDDDSGKGEDKDEVKVTLDQLPAAVQATLKNEAGSGSIGDIEKETKDGKVVYEADVTKDGQEIELKIAEDGTLIKSKIEGKQGDSDEQEGAGDKDDENESGEQD